jgi:hypothetical protein
MLKFLVYLAFLAVVISLLPGCSSPISVGEEKIVLVYEDMPEWYSEVVGVDTSLTISEPGEVVLPAGEYWVYVEFVEDTNTFSFSTKESVNVTEKVLALR